jgi:hypothetical protein
LSLIAVALGFVGFQLGTFNDQRANLFSEARDLIVLRYLKVKYIDDEHLSRLLNQQRGSVGKITVADTPFGALEVSAPSDPLNGDKPRDVTIFGIEIPRSMAGPFIAKITQDQESWKTRKFSLDRLPAHRLDEIFDDLDVSRSLDLSKLIPTLKEKLYRRHVKLPSLDFWDFSTEAASWIIALFCVSVLIALRNSLRQIVQGAEAGIAEPWLILDAEAFGERAVAAAWLFAIPLSGWLTSFGLVLSVMNSLEPAGLTQNWLAVGLIYFLFVVMVAANTWSGVGIVTDLVRIRETRRQIREKPEDSVAEGA